NDPSQANPKRPNMINVWQEDVKITLGEDNEIGGKYAFLSLEKAVDDLNAGKLDALVTAPINKHNIQRADFNFPGHTEYLQSKTNAVDVVMFIVREFLRSGVVTGDIPLNDVAAHITDQSFVRKLNLLQPSLKNDL